MEVHVRHVAQRLDDTTHVTAVSFPYSRPQADCFRLPLAALRSPQTADRSQARSQWKCVFDTVHCDWMESVQLVFDYFCERTPRSFVEARETSLVWNYKYAGAPALQPSLAILVQCDFQNRYIACFGATRPKLEILACTPAVVVPRSQTSSSGASRRGTCCSTCGQAPSATHRWRSYRGARAWR